MVNQERFLVRFWGVRGSYPTPGPHTLRHGGNTSCIEIRAGLHKLILDAGSGIIQLGEALMREAKKQATLNLALFITHAHGDHLIGFPFFAPLFDARTRLHLFGPQLAGHSVEQLVTTVMSPPSFPVDIHTLPSQRFYHTVTNTLRVCWLPDQQEPQIEEHCTEERAEVLNPKNLYVTARFTNSHPLNGAVIYRIDYAGHSIVYATDVEWKNGCESDFLSFVESTDVLIHDAQYSVADYRRGKHGFGHSTIEMATTAAQKTHARHLVLFHHEPTYDDTQLDRMEAAARRRFASTRSAFEGLEIDLLS
jgi:phosphoribosyl 1,2-cyclic phosphodiesterase